MISVDPGNCSGYARWENSQLVSCGVFDLRTDQTTPWYWDDDALVIERPQVYRNGKGDPNDLITLAITCGKIEALYRDVQEVLPNTWKGNVPKDIHHRRILDKLSPRELAVIPFLPATKRHNMVDAIGIGLWYLYR